MRDRFVCARARHTSAPIHTPAHLAISAIVQVEAAQTKTQDFDLRLFEPCLVPTPSTWGLTLSVGTLWTETLTIANGGARDLSWELRETTDTLALLSDGSGGLPTLPPIPPAPPLL